MQLDIVGGYSEIDDDLLRRIKSLDLREKEVSELSKKIQGIVDEQFGGKKYNPATIKDIIYLAVSKIKVGQENEWVI